MPRGFTMLELVAAMAVAFVLISMCMVVAVDTTARGARVVDQACLDRSARLVMQWFMEDAASAWVSAGGVHEVSRNRWPCDRVGFQCLLAAGQQDPDGCIGDLCAVIYQCRDVRAGGRTVRCLMRTLINSSQVYDAAGRGCPEEIWSKEPKEGDLLAEGVVSFRVRRVVRDGGAWRELAARDQQPEDALQVVLVMVAPAWWNRLPDASDWDGAAFLGDPLEDYRHPALRVYRCIIKTGGMAGDAHP